MGRGTVLASAIRKYGRQSFSRKVLVVSDNSEYIYSLEASILTPDLLESKNVYNICGGGKGPIMHSEETKKKLSKILKGNTRRRGTKTSPEGIKRMSEAKSGRKNSMFGKKHSKKTKKKISDANKGEKSYLYGKAYTDEEKKRISDSMKRVWAERKKANGENH